MDQHSEQVIASCDQPTVVRAGGVAAVLQVHGAALDAGSRMSMVFDHVRGTFDATVLRVLVALPSAEGGEVHLGSCALYGLRGASLPKPDGTLGGLQCKLDLSAHAAQLHAALLLQTEIRISILPHSALPDGVEITIERIRLCLEMF
jgi:hypothetical protein